MKVLFLNYEYPPLGGGAGVATRYLLNALDDFGDVTVDLVTSSTGRAHLEQLTPRVRIHYLDIGKKGSLHYQTQCDLMTYAARAFFYARKLLRRETFDLVHAFFGVPSGPVARALGLPYIISLRGSDVPFYNERFEKLDRWVFRRLSRAVWGDAAFVVANSDGLRRLALKTAPDEDIRVIYNGVDTDFFSPPGHRDVREAVILVSTGRLIERKGYHHLIEALSGLDRVVLRLIGDGVEQERLTALAEAHHVRVEFMGPKSPGEVAEALKAAEVFVLPSLNEGMSNALLEALASGLPAIVTDVGGSRELVNDNGVIVRKGDVPALRDAVKGYIENPSRARIHGERSRRKALEMSVSEMARKYRELYFQVMSQSLSGRRR